MPTHAKNKQHLEYNLNEGKYNLSVEYACECGLSKSSPDQDIDFFHNACPAGIPTSQKADQFYVPGMGWDSSGWSGKSPDSAQ